LYLQIFTNCKSLQEVELFLLLYGNKKNNPFFRGKKVTISHFRVEDKIG